MNLLQSVALLAGRPLPFAARAQQVQVVQLPELQRRLARPTDTTYVVNFWATWCGPCVQEWPYFDMLTTTCAGQKVNVLLVSLDYAAQLDNKVLPFVRKHALQSEVLLLNETNPNTYLTQIAPAWTGSRPFTLLLHNARHQRRLFEQGLSAEQLQRQLEAFMQ